jgi:hypothetical protein
MDHLRMLMSVTAVGIRSGVPKAVVNILPYRASYYITDGNATRANAF